jgi:EpsI family protein
MQYRLLALTAAFVSCFAVLMFASRGGVIPAREPLERLPFELGDWQGQSAAPLDAKILAALGADDYINRIYRNQNGREASLYIGYHASQRQGDSIHSPMNCLPGTGWQPIRSDRLELQDPRAAGVDGRRIAVNDVLIQKGEDRQLVLYWYQSQGRVVASEYSAKALLFVDAVRTARTDAALVRIVTPVAGIADPAEHEARDAARDLVDHLLPVLDRHLPN